MATPTTTSKLTRLDRFLLAVAPKFAIARIKARSVAQTYEAAGSGRRTAGWGRSSSDANAAIRPALMALRELSRDLRRNNGWARRGIQVIRNNTVGWGIVPKPIHANKRVAEAALDVWKEWAGSTRCDHDGRLPFYGLQRQVMDTVVESGECLVVRQPASSKDGLPVPMKIQVLEPDYLSPIRDGIWTEGGGIIIQGIEFDKGGRRIAYWLYTRHPGSALAGATIRGAPFATIRVPAEDVLHIYDCERPGQVRGVPWLASAISRLQDLAGYQDAELMQQKIAACFAAFITDFEGAATAIGEQDPSDAELETLEPGHIAYLPPGKQVSFATPPIPAPASFAMSQLRAIAASLGVTYEDLTGDYSQVNFSSARMARLAHWSNVHDWRENMLIPQLCQGVWGWVMELAAGLYSWPTAPAAEWVPPPMPMLEPDKEGLAYSRLMRNGIMTLSQVIREQGYDPETHLAEIAANNKRLDDLKIVLDSDPRRTNAQGIAQAPAEDVEEPPAGKTPPAGGPGNGRARQALPGNGHNYP